MTSKEATMTQDAQTAALQQEMRETQNIIKDYGQMLGDTDGISFYDTSRLPHPKDTIAKALLLAIKLTTDEHQRESLTVALNILARFQDNIGPDQIRPSPVLPDGDKTSPEELLRLFEAHKPESEKFSKLQERALNEEQAYSDMVKKLLSM